MGPWSWRFWALSLALALTACNPRDAEDATLQNAPAERIRLQTVCAALDELLRRDSLALRDPRVQEDVAQADSVCLDVAQEGERAAELRRMQ